MNTAIIECGYVGAALAGLIKNKGNHVTATTRHSEQLRELSRVAQKSAILKGSDHEDLSQLISHHDAIIITSAIDDLDLSDANHLNTALAFRSLALEMHSPKQLIYGSQTWVYGDHHGLWVDETSELRGEGEQARTLVETEKAYLSLEEVGWFVCVLRIAELYGPSRELSQRVKQLEGHLLPGSGSQYTNMVHKEDATHAFYYALRHHFVGIYNVVDDDHTPRDALYAQVCRKFHLPKVKWNPTLPGFHSGNKRVSNHKIKSAGYAFLHPHRVLD